MQEFDVAIIGAGPAGSAAALTLARKGFTVVLIDKALFPRDKLCGDFLNPINWPLLEDFQLKEEILALEHTKVRSFRITSIDGAEAGVSFRTGHGESFFGLGVRRWHLDHLLLRQAANFGAAVKQDCKVIGLTRAEAGWIVELADAGAREQVRATVLIGADGRNSWVARRAGMSVPGTVEARSVGFQVHLRYHREVDDGVEIHLFPGGYAGLVGIGANMLNLCFTVERKRLPRNFSFESFLHCCLAKNPHLRAVLSRTEVAGKFRSVYPVYFPPRRSFGDHVLLVGDAARVTEPVTGEGIYAAMKSGVLAANAIEKAFAQREFSARRMRVYGAACQNAFRRRRLVNHVIRHLIYHPLLLSAIIRLSSKRRQPLNSIVHQVCQPDLLA